jgi:hypothetical protein
LFRPARSDASRQGDARALDPRRAQRGRDDELDAQPAPPEREDVADEDRGDGAVAAIEPEKS